jgi:hypothetical protein
MRRNDQKTRSPFVLGDSIVGSAPTRRAGFAVHRCEAGEPSFLVLPTCEREPDADRRARPVGEVDGYTGQAEIKATLVAITPEVFQVAKGVGAPRKGKWATQPKGSLISHKKRARSARVARIDARKYD